MGSTTEPEPALGAGRPGVAVIGQQGFVVVIGHAGLTPLHDELFHALNGPLGSEWQPPG
jgi:hypothetical protein